MMRKILQLILILTVIYSNFVNAQSCVPTNINGQVITLGCLQTCTNLSFQVPHLKSTEDYVVNSIPYVPNAWTTATGTALPSIYIDDKYSDSLDLTFPFCFYGGTYAKCVVGSNGIISFDIVSNANKSNAYVLTVGGVAQPIFYAGGSPGSISPAYYPKASIMGPYHDIDPNNSSTSQPADRKIEYRVEGTAPCRKFVVSFYHIPYFLHPADISSEQIVLYENTGLIEIFIESKPATSSGTNNGLAILGMQNWNRDKQTSVAGRNCTLFSANNEGWRFTPNGLTSSFINSELLTLTGTHVAFADTSTTTAGILNLNFPNICPIATGATQYIVKTSFQSCPSGTIMFSNDTITINRTSSLPASTSVTPTTCGSSIGTAIVTVTGGTAPFTFSIDGGAATAPLPSPYTFNGLSVGPHTIIVTDALGCTTTLNITITSSTSIAGTATQTATSCPGVNNGTISISPSSGTAPYKYQLDGGTLSAPSSTIPYVFTNVAAGSHTITFFDAGGCSGTVTITVVAGTSLLSTATPSPTSCPGVNNGTILVTPSTGTAPYIFHLDGGAAQPTGVFVGVGAGSHTITFTDNNGCNGSVTTTVTAGSGISATANQTPSSCPSINNGTITIVPSNGTAPFTYQLDGGTAQATGIFTNVATGNHTVTYIDNNGCTGSSTIFVATGAGLIANTNSTATSCPTVNNGTITITPITGTAPYMYSIDGGAAQASNVFINVAAGNHNITFTDNLACASGTIVVNVAAGAVITGTASSTATSCPGLNNGTITVTPTTGAAPYMYSLDGGATQASNIFTNVAAGNHNITFTDNIGCASGSININVAQGSAISSTLAVTQPVCNIINDGTITITPTSGTPVYAYTLNGGAAQGSNIFTGLAPSTYNIAITDGMGCTGTNAVTLVTNPAIVTSSSFVMPLCQGVANGSITITATGGVAPYTYELDASGTFVTNNIFSGLLSGVHTIITKDAVGCINTIVVNLPQPASVVASATQTLTASCANNDGQITVTANGGTPTYQYSINNGTTYQASNVFTGLSVATYNQIMVKDLNGCTVNVNTVPITLNDTMRLSLQNTTICVGSSATLVPNTNAQTTVYTWTPNNSTISNTTIANPVVTPTDTTTYFLTAQFGTCQRSVSAIVNVLHKPISHAGNDTTLCIGDSAFLHGTSSNLSGGVWNSWSPNVHLRYTSLDSSRATVRPDSLQQYIFTVKDNYGCNFTVSDSMMVYFNPRIIPFAGNDTNAILNRPHQLMATGGTSYSWSPTMPLSNPLIANPTAILHNDTYFTVTVYDNIGCHATDDIFIHVYEGPYYYVPNVFSPNGDGLNDIFMPEPVGIVRTDYFRVFNRYGQLVFETNQWHKGWDGKYKGQKPLADTYVWIIKGVDKNGMVVEQKGTVILLK